MKNELERRISRAAAMGLLGPGRQLHEEARWRMEQMLGRRLPIVRINEGLGAATAARLLGARAFAVGGQIYAPPGKIETNTVGGTALLAHELTHVAQQSVDQTVVPASDHEPLAARASARDESGLEGDAVESEQRVLPRPLEIPEVPQPDPAHLADLVYELMLRELQIYRERWG